MQALSIQLENDLKKYEVKNLKSLYIGGGTPSVVEAKEYPRLFKIIFPYLQKDAEVTIEANPNNATLEWLLNIKSLGVNRISFGVQSFDDTKLKYLGRKHNSTMAKKAIENAYKVGFKNISIDIMYDTIYDTKEFIKNEFNHIKTLPINHLSLYSLTIEKNTTFDKQQTKTLLINPQLIKTLAQENGFIQYEVANFGKQYESAHNKAYWEYDEYLGVGAGAVGRIANQRYYPLKDVKKYIQNPLFKTSEKLSQDDIKTEKILLGLRSSVGFDTNILNYHEKTKLNILQKEKKIKIKNNIVYNKNFFIADEIALFLVL